VSRVGHGCSFAGPAPYIPAAEGGIDGHYIVSMGGMVGWPELGREKPFREVIEELTARLGITVTRTRQSGRWFCAALTEDQLDRVRSEPGVLRVEQDAEIQPAPVFLAPPPHGVEGEYIVSVRNAVDPLSVAARLNVDIQHIFDIFVGFSARMTSADVDRARHDPDVVHIEQNTIAYFD
jgi:Peptidase inhibitor I9